MTVWLCQEKESIIRVGKGLRFRLEDLDVYLAERTSRTWERVDGRGRPAKTRRA